MVTRSRRILLVFLVAVLAVPDGVAATVCLCHHIAGMGHQDRHPSTPRSDGAPRSGDTGAGKSCCSRGHAPAHGPEIGDHDTACRCLRLTTPPRTHDRDVDLTPGAPCPAVAADAGSLLAGFVQTESSIAKIDPTPRRARPPQRCAPLLI